MSNIGSLVERTVQLQLERFKNIPPIPLFVALVIFSGVSVIKCVSSTSIPSLPTTLWKALAKPDSSDGIPLLNSIFNVFTCALNTANLRLRISAKVPFHWRQMFSRGAGKSRSCDTYATPRAEASYWRVADRYRRRLYGCNGHPSPSRTSPQPSRDSTVIPLVTYYTPRLLPLYRDRSRNKRTSRGMDLDVQESRISPRTFCKWHRMVFQDSCHPTLAQAAMQIKYYSNRDLREIQRIARLLPDEQVFSQKRKGTRKLEGTTKYNEMWLSWLENKGTDLVIVFE